MRLILSVLCAIWLAIPNGARAAQVDGLYEAVVPVVERTDASRRAAARAAMGLVLIKLTGDRRAVGASATAAIRQSAERYVQQYAYERAPVAPGTDGADSSGLVVRFLFDARALAPALRDTGYAVWGRERPATLLWLLVQALAGPPAFRGVEDNDPVTEVSREQGQVRGIPLLLPLLDLDDQLRVTPGDITHGDFEGVLQASQRYGTDAILIGALHEVRPGTWQSEWRMQIDGDWLTWSSTGDDPALLADEAVNAAADGLAQRFSAAGSAVAADAITITVAQVRSTRDYARALRYLEALESVAALELTGVVADRVVLRMQVRGGAAGLAQTAALGGVLQPATDNPGVLLLIPE